MHEQDKPEVTSTQYPIGRGYGHDYMRGGEVFGGYGYADRPEYEQRRGDSASPVPVGHDAASVEPDLSP